MTSSYIVVDPARIPMISVRLGIPDLREMQQIVGGYIEFVDCTVGDVPCSIVVNEEGLYDRTLIKNVLATHLRDEYWRGHPDTDPFMLDMLIATPLVGTAIFMSSNRNNDGDSLMFDDAERESVVRVMLNTIAQVTHPALGA